MSKKALIITYYEAPNYGAFLQAYATQSFLRAHGVECWICKHCANKPNLLTKLLDKRIPSEVIAYRQEIQAKIDEVQKYLQISGNKASEYDLAIIGSDEVWNIKNLTAVHLPVFFQPYKRAVKTVAYGACAGKCQAKHMKLLPYTSGIRKLDAVSVRDAHTWDMARDLGITDPVRVLDPTFLYPFEKELPPRAMAEDYILVYTYGLSQDQIRGIQEFARKRNLKIVATGSKCEWADENPLPSPFEWLSLIKHSAYVITSTFHGTVFGIIFNKQFATVGNRSNKVSSLLKELRLEDRLVSESAGLDEKLEAVIDYGPVNTIKQQRVNESAQFILNNL